MIVFLASGFSTSSETLKNRLEKNLNLKSFTFKSGSGVGHLNINIRLKKLIKLKFLKLIKSDILLEQHLFPIKNNLEILDSLFGLNNIKFIVTYRNIFDTINNLLKRKNKTNTFHFFRSNFYPTYDNFKSEKFNINIFDVITVINFYALWFKIEKEKYIKNLEFISFDENTKDVNIVNQKLTKFLGRRINLDQKISANLFKNENHNINEKLKEFIYDYAKSFKDIDFKRIGL